jgi:hypothetical protein
MPWTRQSGPGFVHATSSHTRAACAIKEKRAEKKEKKSTKGFAPT